MTDNIHVFRPNNNNNASTWSVRHFSVFANISAHCSHLFAVYYCLVIWNNFLSLIDKNSPVKPVHSMWAFITFLQSSSLANFLFLSEIKFLQKWSSNQSNWFRNVLDSSWLMHAPKQMLKSKRTKSSNENQWNSYYNSFTSSVRSSLSVIEIFYQFLQFDFYAIWLLFIVELLIGWVKMIHENDSITRTSWQIVRRRGNRRKATIPQRIINYLIFNYL